MYTDPNSEQHTVTPIATPSPHNPRRGRALTSLALATALTLSAATAAGAAPGRPGQPRFTEGAPGVGDPYLPQSGNGDIDVEHYDLDLRYAPLPAEPVPPPVDEVPEGPLYEAGHLDATATITLVPQADLSSFNLDLQGLNVESVTVNGKKARFSRDGQELTISPRPKLREGRVVTVEIQYSGTPESLSGSIGQTGWIATDDGVLALNEPHGAMTWFPANDHPTDVASYTMDITVPEGLEAISNGLLVDQTTADGWTTWSWDAPDEMATYLAMVSIGEFRINQYTTAAGIPVIDAVDVDLGPEVDEALAVTEEQLEFYTDYFGEYPGIAYGSVVDDFPGGYALETHTRPVYAGFFHPVVGAHEMAHQWMGNTIRPATWQEIWLNESWATELEALWAGPSGTFGQVMTPTEYLQQLISYMPEDPELWAPIPVDPGVDDMFSVPVYYKGGYGLDEIRRRVGDDVFREIARAWVWDNEDSLGTTQEFQDLAESISGQDLDDIFAQYMFSSGHPFAAEEPRT